MDVTGSQIVPLYSTLFATLEKPEMFHQLCRLLAEISGAAAVSLWSTAGGEENLKRTGYWSTDGNVQLSTEDYRLIRQILGSWKTNNSGKSQDGRYLYLTCSFSDEEQFSVIINFWFATPLACQEKIEFASTLVQGIKKELLLAGKYFLKFNLLKNEKRLSRELREARQIQQSFLPAPENFTQLSAGFRQISAYEVSGDYLDIIATDGGNYVICVGDVMGKGIPAAIVMAALRTAVRMVAGRDLKPDYVLTEINRIMYEDLQKLGMFVTLLYVFYHPRKKLLLFANGGHLPPLLFRPGEKETVLDLKGTMIGGKREKKYGMKAVQLQEGDVVVLYTDGVIDAEDKDGNRFGLERMVSVIKGNITRDAPAIADALAFHIGQFTGGSTPRDDITFVILKI